MRGDLERIVLKALEKDRRQRYQSAADLLRDIRHYLNREPIEARPPTPWTRTLRWVARHPAWATTALCLAIAVMVFAAAWGSVWWYAREPYAIVRYDAMGEVVTPEKEARGIRAVEARLLSRNRGVIHHWSTSTGHITIAELIERPSELDGGRVVILGFCDANEYEWGNALVAFDLERSMDEPDWVGAPTEGELLPDSHGRGYGPRDFYVSRTSLIEDIFPDEDHPGPEIVAVHSHGTYSQRIIRIYDLNGDVLYQIWHNGSVRAMYWMDEPGLLVCVGDNGEALWSDLGWKGISSPQPKVIFAIQPEPGEVHYEFLETKPGVGSLDPRWYWCTFPPEFHGNLDRPVLPHLSQPRKGKLGRAVMLTFNCLDTDGEIAGGIWWELDEAGNEISESRNRSDEYRQNLIDLPKGHRDRLPEPEEIRLVPWPPPPPATP